MSFSLQSSVQAFKAEGDRQAKENGIVELFSCMAACAKDPFRGIYRPSKWIDRDGSEFAFILVKGNEVIPQKNKKLRDILRELKYNYSIFITLLSLLSKNSWQPGIDRHN